MTTVLLWEFFPAAFRARVERYTAAQDKAACPLGPMTRTTSDLHQLLSGLCAQPTFCFECHVPCDAYTGNPGYTTKRHVRLVPMRVWLQQFERVALLRLAAEWQLALEARQQHGDHVATYAVVNADSLTNTASTMPSAADWRRAYRQQLEVLWHVGALSVGPKSTCDQPPEPALRALLEPLVATEAKQAKSANVDQQELAHLGSNHVHTLVHVRLAYAVTWRHDDDDADLYVDETVRQTRMQTVAELATHPICSMRLAQWQTIAKRL